MSFHNILGLFIATLFLAISPGQGVFITVSKAMTLGLKKTIFVILGIVAGDIIFLLFAVFGLSAVTELFGSFFIIVKYLSSIYLIFMGIKLWRNASIQTSISNKFLYSNKNEFISGLSVTLGNPKVILFYFSFLPAFLNLKTLSSFDVVLVILVVSFVLFAVMFFYAFIASKVKDLINSKLQIRFNRLAGVTMFSVGVIIMFDDEF